MARPKPAIPGILHVPAPPPDWYIRHYDHRGRIIPAVQVRERADQALRKIKKEPRK